MRVTAKEVAENAFVSSHMYIYIRIYQSASIRSASSCTLSSVGI